MAGRLSRADLFAGVLAIALLLMALVAGVQVPVAIGLAVVTYVIVRLLRPASQPDEPADETHRQQLAFQEALANVEAISALQPRIAKPAIREQVGRILDQIARVLAAMQEDRNLAVAPLFNDHLLTPVRALLTEYVRLSNRGVSSASDLLDRTETNDLPRIERAIHTFYERLHRSHVVDLATLVEVLELDLERIDTTSSRRFTQ